MLGGFCCQKKIRVHAGQLDSVEYLYILFYFDQKSTFSVFTLLALQKKVLHKQAEIAKFIVFTDPLYSIFFLIF